MAKSTSKKAPKTYPSSIEFRLDAPGMTKLHRAGLGGLAATLHCAEVLKRDAEEEDEDLPELLAPLFDPEFSWKIESKSLTINFGKPENAGKFFEALSNFAFQIQDGVIYLPGQYQPGAPPPIEVRARLQQGITSTFLQHGKTRKLGEETSKSYQFDNKTIEIGFKPCLQYLHQGEWKDWIDKKGNLVAKSCTFNGPLYPGAAVRHQAFTADTSAAQSVEFAIALTFAVVGTLTFPVAGGLGILLVPYVADLTTFVQNRHKATPADFKETFVANLSDAVLHFSLNERGSEVKSKISVPGCEGCCFCGKPWSGKQKSRDEALVLTDPSYEQLNAYAVALKNLKPKIKSIDKEITEGKGKNKVVVEKKTEYFWKDSKLRPFVANNLAQNQYWFQGFAQYVKKLDESGKRTIWELVRYENKELNAMINDKDLDWKLNGAQPFVFAVQDALRRLYGKISADSKGLSENGRNNRFDSEYEKWRLAFSGSKTAEQFRKAFADMLSRAKSNQSLAENRQAIVKLLIEDWELSRDLALLALASYRSKNSNEESAEQSDTTSEENV